MTVKTHRKQRRMRNSVMESLGFTETQTVNYVSNPNVAAPATQPPQLVSTKQTPGGTVQEIWETTELRANSMVDWQPVDVDKKRLNKRVRWPLTLIWIVILGVVGGGAYWLWQAPTNAADVAAGTVIAHGDSLQTSLEPLTQAVESLEPGSGPVDEAFTSAVAVVDDASRDLFSSAAELPASEVALRTNATEAATQALDASRNATNLAAYLASVTAIMAPPNLITDPGLIDLATAATDFGDWRGKFEIVRSNLPDGIMSSVSNELSAIAATFDSVQADYLDGLREEDAGAAAAALAELDTKMQAAWDLLVSEAEAAKAAILDRIANADDSLSLLS